MFQAGCCAFLLLSTSYARELTVADLRAFVEDYRNGNHFPAAQALQDSDLKSLSARSVEFVAAYFLK